MMNKLKRIIPVLAIVLMLALLTLTASAEEPLLGGALTLGNPETLDADVVSADMLLGTAPDIAAKDIILTTANGADDIGTVDGVAEDVVLTAKNTEEEAPVSYEAGDEILTTGNGTEDTAESDGDDSPAPIAVKEEKKGLSLADIISLAVLGAIIIAVVIWCLCHKEKTGKFFRSLKSDFKKIVWLPWDQTRKNTLVVLVVTIIVAIVIGLLDFVFLQGITALGTLF